MSGRNLAFLGLGVMGFPMPAAVLAWRRHCRFDGCCALTPE
jgi:hypothetical protein